MTYVNGPKGYFRALALYRSTDGGATWTVTKANDTNSYAAAIAVDPVQEKILFMGYNDYDAGRFRLVKSVDGGAGWKSVPTGTIRDIEDIEFDPQNPKTIFLGAGYSGLFWSDNGGLSWKRIPGGFQASSILFSKKAPRRLFVAGSDAVQMSGDQGHTWEPIDIGPGRGYDCMSLGYDETRKILYIGTKGGGVIKKQL